MENGGLRVGGMSLALALAGACGGTSEHARTEVLLDPPANAPEPVVDRWVAFPERVLLGPPDAKGDAVAVVGGRRLVLRADGSAQEERAPTGGVIDGAALVPMAAGTRVVALSGKNVLRFDDPLGAPVVVARLERPASVLGALPGRVVIDDGRTRVVDTASGRDVSHDPVLPLLPHSSAFVDGRRGFADFAGVGVLQSDDGGVTWKDALGSGGGFVHAVGGEVRAMSSGVPVRLASGPPPSSPTARWIARTETDPLLAAIELGTRGPSGTAFVVRDGLLARVDLRSGVVLELLELASRTPQCGVTTGGPGRLRVACSASGSATGRKPSEKGVVAEVSTEGSLQVVSRTPTDARRSVVTALDGGLAFESSCSGDEYAWCVLQPDGSLQTVAPAPGSRADVLPRRDGTLVRAYVTDKNLVVDGVRGTAVVEEMRVPVEDEKDVQLVERGRELAVAVTLDGGITDAMQDNLRRVRFGPIARGQSELPERFEAKYAVARHGVLVLAEAEGVVVLRSGEPPRRLASRGKLDRYPMAVGDVGLRLGRWAHVGWSGLDAIPSGALPSPNQAPKPVAGRLECTTSGDPLRSLRDRLLEGQEAKGQKWIVLDRDDRHAIALRHEVPRQARKSGRWHLRWASSSSSFMPHAAEVPAPTDEPPVLQDAAVYGGTLALVVRAGASVWIVGATHGRAVATEARREVFSVGAGADGTIAWDVNGALMLQPPGEAARKIATGIRHAVSTPSREGLHTFLPTGSARLGATTSEARPGLDAFTGPGLDDLEAMVLASCPKGEAGRQIRVGDATLEIVVDGAPQPQHFTDLYVAIDGAKPCLASLRARTGGGRGTAIVADVADGNAEWSAAALREARCTWTPRAAPAP